MVFSCRLPLNGRKPLLTDQERADRIASLLAERARYEARGLPNSVAAVNRELARLTDEATVPARRAAQR